MSADKSFMLTIDKLKKKEAINLLSRFCLNEDKTVLKNISLGDNLNIDIVLDRHAELETYGIFSEHNLSINDKYVFGTVVLSIKENESNLSFDFWPLNNHLFKTLNKSSELQRRFINLVKETDGYDFKIENGDGSTQIVFNNRDIESDYP